MRTKLLAAAALFAAGFALGIWAGAKRTAGDIRSTSGQALMPASAVIAPVAERKLVTVHTATAIGKTVVTSEADVKGELAADGSWTFKQGDGFTFTFDPQKKRGHYKLVQELAVNVLLERDQAGATHASGSVWEVRDGKAFRQIPVAHWEVTTVEPVQPRRERAAAIEQSVGIGVAAGGWSDAAPCLTYSLARIGRLRAPSFVIDTGARAGAGAQLRLWRPFHAGAFYTWDLDGGAAPSVRLTATLNL